MTQAACLKHRIIYFIRRSEKKNIYKNMLYNTPCHKNVKNAMSKYMVIMTAVTSLM